MLVAALMVSAVSAVMLLTQAFENAVSQNKSVLEQASQSMELLFGNVDTVALTVSQDSGILENLEEAFSHEAIPPNARDGEVERIRKYISGTAYSVPYIYSVYVYVDNVHGHFVSTDAMVNSNNQQIMQLKYYYDTAWYESYMLQKEDKEIWTESRIIQRYDFEGPKEVISRYRTVYPMGLVTKGVIVENVEKKTVCKMLDSIRILNGQQIQIYNESDELLLAYPEGDIEESNVLRAEIPSQRFGWTYVSVIPYSMLFQSLFSSLWVLMFILICSCAFATVLALFVTQSKYKRALRVIHAVESRNPESFLGMENKQDEYDYFLESMLREYMENTNLEMTISEQKYQLRIMEILALQSQINPHFLFNTLEVIKWESIGLTHGENNVSRMLEDLAEVIGYALGDAHERVLLREEIEVTKSYVQILQNRYPDKFAVDWQCSDSLLDWMTPKLILQPLIENSVYHGIKEKPGFCRIRIKIYQRKEDLFVRVTNNGVGMTKERLTVVRAVLKDTVPPERIGLYNIVKRLSLLFPDRCAVQIYSKESLGTSVCIRIKDYQQTKEEPL